MKKSELQQIIREEINKFKYDSGIDDNTLANHYASKLTNQLFSEKIYTPLEYIMKWGDELEIDKEVNGRLNKDQIEDLKKEAKALIKISNGKNSVYKQVLKNKIISSLNSVKIR
jgi:hypothetical protein